MQEEMVGTFRLVAQHIHVPVCIVTNGSAHQVPDLTNS